MGSERLFVYGSLKRGGRHHELLFGARFVDLAETEPGYRLVPEGEYLALEPSAERGERGQASGRVSGEVFEIDARRLPALDEFEGEAYWRAPLRVSLQKSGQLTDALAYLRRTR